MYEVGDLEKPSLFRRLSGIRLTPSQPAQPMLLMSLRLKFPDLQTIAGF
jgi:hypothetical protein